jgi:hypothetical protein
MFTKLPASLLVLLALAAPAAIAAPAPTAENAEATDSAEASGAKLLQFDTDLRQFSDLTLPGTHGTQNVSLTFPRSWQLKSDPVLKLSLSHSAALLPNRSHLTVLLNEQPVGSVTLDETNITAGTVEITLPRGLIQDYNTLRFAAVQHYTDDCEDPFDPTLWTRVSTQSSVEVDYERRPVREGLDAWPYPIVDKLAMGAIALTPVLSAQLTPDTTRAAGQVALTLGRLASYHTLQVEPAVATLAEAHSAALIVGTIDENPVLRELLGSLSLGPSDGVVAVLPNPADPTLPVLIVSGGGAEGVAKAAQALTAQDRQPVLTGTVAVVRTAVPASPPPNTQSPRPAPRTDAFPLSALGVKGTTVRGFYTEGIRIPLRLEGDTYIRPGGGSLTLRYGYSGQLSPTLSSMEVRLDGLSLRSVPLDHEGGLQDGEVTIRLPEDLLTPDSTVEVVFQLFPKEFDLCKRVSDQQIWGTLYDSSTLDMPRDHVANMPDLGRLRFDGWPLHADDSDGAVIAAIPDAPSAEAWSAGLELSGLIGRYSMAADPKFKLELASATSMSQNADAHFVVLADSSKNTLYDALAYGKSLTSLEDGATRSLLGNDKATLASSENNGKADTLEQILQPSNSQRSALVLHAGVEGGLTRLVDLLADSGKLKRTEGNLVVLAEDGSLRVVDTAKRERWGTLPIATEARIGVRQNWGLLGAAVLVGAIAIALAVRMIVRARKDA